MSKKRANKRAKKRARSGSQEAGRPHMFDVSLPGGGDVADHEAPMDLAGIDLTETATSGPPGRQSAAVTDSAPTLTKAKARRLLRHDDLPAIPAPTASETSRSGEPQLADSGSSSPEAADLPPIVLQRSDPVVTLPWATALEY